MTVPPDGNDDAAIYRLAEARQSILIAISQALDAIAHLARNGNTEMLEVYDVLLVIKENTAIDLGRAIDKARRQ